jgi:uncharacterized protein (DUF2141 family)
MLISNRNVIIVTFIFFWHINCKVIYVKHKKTSIMRKNVKLTLKVLALLILFGGLMTGCKKDQDESQVAVKVTDAPFPMPFVSEANIGITKIELRNTNGDYVTVFNGNTSVNLVNYTNGATAEVAVQTVPAGTYNQVKITMGDVSVKLTDNRTFDITATANHSFTQNINPELEVANDTKSDLLIDIDLSESFEFTGITGWVRNVLDITGIDHFEPDFRAVNLSQTGNISGQVVDANGNPVANAMVYVSYNYNNDGQDEDVSTIAKADGTFKIIGLPQGNYNVEASADNNLDGDISNVSVSIQHETSVNIVVQ